MKIIFSIRIDTIQKYNYFSLLILILLLKFSQRYEIHMFTNSSLLTLNQFPNLFTNDGFSALKRSLLLT